MKKVIVSDGITDKKISVMQWINRYDFMSRDYPFVTLDNGTVFYYNRFLFLL